MKRFRHYLFLLLVAASGPWTAAHGQWTVDSCRATFQLGDVRMVALPGTSTVRLEADGMACLAPAAGKPALPQASRLLLLPRGTKLHVDSCTTGRIATLQLEPGCIVQPYGGATVKDLPLPTPLPDSAVYGSVKTYRSGPPVEVEDLGTMGEWQVFRLTARPVAYLPAEGTLQLTTSLTVGFSTEGPKQLQSHGPKHLLVVARPQFREGLQPFIRWKRQTGLLVTELYADTNKREAVKAMIVAEAGRHAVDYILLVGDAAQIQAFIGTTHPAEMEMHTTDLYYAELTGDYLPDALIGRWPVNDTAQLGAVVRKTLRYEQGIDLDTAQLQRLLLVAGAESQTPAPVTTNGQVNYLARELKQAHPAMDTLCYRNPASADQRPAILSDLRQGAALLNYTAHCNVAGWSSPAVTFTNIDTLGLTQPMLYVNNCCKSNDFSGTCFGEQLLRKPVGGAVGVIGAINSTLWEEDFYWAVGPKYPFGLQPAYDSLRPGAFDRWAGRAATVQTQGELLAAGNLAVTAFGSPYDKFYWEIYCLLGDPTLRPWLGAPQTIELHFTDGLPGNGDNSLHLGGTPGFTVTAMQHDTVLGIGAVGTDGLLSLALAACLDTTPLILTATAHGRLPRIDTVTVQAAADTGVALRDVTVGDSTVQCRVENVGLWPLHGLRVVLGQLEADSTVDALIAEEQTLLDTLLPHQSIPVALPLRMEAVGQLPYWQAQLYVQDSTGEMLCRLTLERPVDVVYPTATFRLLEADGDEAHRLLPRHSYRLAASVEGPADSFSLAVTALPGGENLDPQLFTTPDTLTHLHIASTLTLGRHRHEYSYYLVAEPRTEAFDNGFASYPWRQAGTQPWTIDESHARSGDIDYRQTSDLILDVLLHQADTVSFWAWTSCEVQHDKFQFFVDGVRRGIELWGESNRKRYEVALDPGPHTLRWRYAKDGSGDAGSDCAWVDDVRLPLALWDSAYGCFAPPLSVLQPPTSDLLLYPNPTSGTVAIQGVASGTLTVLDLMGRPLHTLTLQPHSTVVQLPPLPDGIYLLQLDSPQGRLYQKLIIRQ